MNEPESVITERPLPAPPAAKNATLPLLGLIVLLLGVQTYFAYEERERRAATAQQVSDVLKEMDQQRQEALKNFVKASQSPETTTIYQQMYLADNAQLAMLNLMVQGQALAATR